MRKKTDVVKGRRKRAGNPYKKTDVGNPTFKAAFRVVQESPIYTKIDKATINQAVESALSVASRQ